MSTSAAQTGGLYPAFGDQDAARLFAQLSILNEYRMGRHLLSPADKHTLFLSVSQTMSTWPVSIPVIQNPHFEGRRIATLLYAHASRIIVDRDWFMEVYIPNVMLTPPYRQGPRSANQVAYLQTFALPFFNSAKQTFVELVRAGSSDVSTGGVQGEGTGGMGGANPTA